MLARRVKEIRQVAEMDSRALLVEGQQVRISASFSRLNNCKTVVTVTSLSVLILTLLCQGKKQQVVLELEHLQGAFYLLFLGSTLAFLTLLLENLVSSLSGSQQHIMQVHNVLH